MTVRVKRIITVIVGTILMISSVICSTYMLRGYTRLCGYYDLDPNSVDVVFVGTSVTFTAFMPMEAWKDYGIVSYNYSTNVQFENAMRYSLVDVERSQNPKLIMVDIAPFLYEHYAGNEDWSDEDHQLFIKYNLDSRNYTLDRFALVNEINRDMHGSFSDYWYYFFDISRYHTREFAFERYDNAEKDVGRGYGYLEHNKGDVWGLDRAVYDDGSTVKLKEQEQYYLDKLLETAKKMDAEVVFFCAPIYFWRQDQPAKKNYMRDYIEEQGFAFADFSNDIDEIGIDYKTDLWNVNHFDALGAEKVTKYLCEYLVNNYDIPDRRGDEKYAEWDSDYAEWEVIKTEYEETDRGIRVSEEPDAGEK